MAEGIPYKSGGYGIEVGSSERYTKHQKKEFLARIGPSRRVTLRAELMAHHSITGRLREGLLTGLLAGFLGLTACGGGGSSTPRPPSPPPPPTQSLSQIVSLVNDVDIDYRATLTNVSQATRTITRDGTQISATTITTSPYTELFNDMRKGGYSFRLESSGLTPHTASLNIPNYTPTSSFGSLDADLNEQFEGSSKTFNLETLLSDKNPEDRPVPLNSASSLDGKTQTSISGHNLTVTATGSPGPYQVEVNYGSTAGGLGSSVLSGQIIAVPEQIAYTGFVSSNFDIYSGDLVNNALTNIRRLTTDPAQDFESSWSPDGEKMAFTSNRDGRNRIYIMGIDGGNQQVISPELELAQNPTWCLDQSSNEKILFSFVDSGKTGIASMNSTGSGIIKLVEETYIGIVTGNPTCSPSGLEFAFETFKDGNSEIYVATLSDGSNQRNLTNNLNIDSQPRWSRDGSTIAFITDRDTPGQAGELNLYLMNTDGSGHQRLTEFPGREFDLSWSSDSSKVAFTKVNSIGDPFHIYTMNVNGSDLTQITTTDQNRYPAWRPRP